MAAAQDPAAPRGRWERIVARCSTRGFGFALVAALVVLLVVVLLVPLGRSAAHDRAAPRRSPHPHVSRPVALRAAWPHRLTFITDSVGLGSVQTLRRAMGDWIVRVRGHAALMVPAALANLRAHPFPIEKVAVVALGYNSLWQHARRDYAHWADVFDHEALELIAYLRHHGARKIVWVTLRTPHRRVVPHDALWQYRAYAWYFPYVDEQLRALDRRLPYLVLADWQAVSDHAGLTYDAIHLDPTGALL